VICQTPKKYCSVWILRKNKILQARLQMAKNTKNSKELQTLKQRLEEAEETIRAIRGGEIDALVVKGSKGDSVYTLKSADYTYRVLVEEMEEGALSVNFEGIILYCNKKFSDIVKKPLKNVIGSLLFSYISAGDASVFNELFNAGKRKRCRGELRLLTKKGKTPVSLSVIPLKQNYESPLLNVVVTDLTEKRESEKIKSLMDRFEQQAETLETIINNSEDNVSLIDSKQRFLFVNPSIEKMVGRKAEDMVGKTLETAGYPKKLAKTQNRNLVEIFKKGIKLRGEYSINTTKGERWYEYIMTPMKRNEMVVAVVTISRDITDKKEIERQKDAFVGIASHELKTPITSMKAFAQILKKGSKQKRMKKMFI
jgi:two-component system, OmpR family, phosphate regulon sensor histidine kinase PhoR